MRLCALLLLLASPLLAQHGPPPGHPGGSQHALDGVSRGSASKPKPTGESITLVAKDGTRVDLKPVPIAKEKSFSWFGVATVQRWVQVPQTVPLAVPERIEFGLVDPTKGSNTILVKLIPEKDLWTVKLACSFSLSSRPREGFEPFPGRRLPKPKADDKNTYRLTLPDTLSTGTYALVSEVEAWVFRIGESELPPAMPAVAPEPAALPKTTTMQAAAPQAR